MSGVFPAAAGLVDRALAGFAAAHEDLVELHRDPVFVRARHRDPSRRVGLVSGGGSGHEPLHIGMVGVGMLDAAVPGKIFASPHNRQVYVASGTVAGPDGVLHIVKNYTGDRINFGIAAERLLADGIPVRRVLVDDDIATDSADTRTGRRGTAATVVVEKIVGAAADTGLGLDELAELGTRVAARSRSLAVASGAHTSPSTGRLAFEIAEDELEYGVGIHGERASRTVPRPPLDELVRRMVGEVLAACPEDESALVVVNGLGGTTAVELSAIYAEIVDIFDERSIVIGGALLGTYCPALDMRGFSITVTMLEPGWAELFAAPAETVAIRRGGAR